MELVSSPATRSQPFRHIYLLIHVQPFSLHFPMVSWSNCRNYRMSTFSSYLTSPLDVYYWDPRGLKIIETHLIHHIYKYLYLLPLLIHIMTDVQIRCGISLEHYRERIKKYTKFHESLIPFFIHWRKLPTLYDNRP